MSQNGTPTSYRGAWDDGNEAGAAESSIGARSAPTLEPSGSTSRPRMRDKLRPWKTTVAGRRKSSFFSSNDPRKKDSELVAGDPYVQAAVGANAPLTSPTRTGEQTDGIVENGYEWEEDSDGGSEGLEPDAYSWVDPSLEGTSAFRGSPAGSSRDVRAPGAASSLLDGPLTPVAPPDPPPVSPSYISGRNPRVSANHQGSSRPTLNPHDSYNLLVSFQTNSYASSRDHSRNPSRHLTSLTSTEGGHRSPESSQWYELVDESILHTLGKDETRRQGLWFEVISGELDYVRDLRVMCDDFIAPLRSQQPPVLVPEQRMEAFVREVFSTTQLLMESHVRMLDRLLERQRQEWPLLTTAADILLTGFFEMANVYEKYMKNYPFADARVKRERDQNPKFKLFLNDRTTAELTQRRDVFVLLSRPMTRLPRIMLQLTTALQYTPTDHPDQESIPALTDSLSRIIKGSQPGIESAESKIKLWNVAEKLLFKRGEIIEMDISDGKRTLVHEGYVFRRIRSETNWHGWQDLRMILLDNYMLLTRDEEQGRLVVVSRPIHLDFLNIVTMNGAPERRHDNVSRWKSNGPLAENGQPERLMFPFTISTSGGLNARTYTICTATPHAREIWRQKIEGAKTIRHFDLENNGSSSSLSSKLFALHPLSVPSVIRDPILSAETFQWRGRETLALVTAGAVWVGWRHDSSSMRELIRLPGRAVSSIALVVDFGWLLVVHGGSLLAFNLHTMIPTSDPSTWSVQGKSGAVKISSSDHSVAFVRMGYTKDRLMVVYAAHAGNNTILSYYEPLVVYEGNEGFRHFATSAIPGYASELGFFKQTVAIVTEKGFIIAEPGNPNYNQIPTFPPDLHAPVIRRMMDNGKPLAMYQTSENEFLLVYQWGACFVTKFGEISRNGLYLRWNLAPTYCVYKSPYLLLFDESTSKVEVRDTTNGKMCELIVEKGLKAIRSAKRDGNILALSARGLLEIKETVPL